MRPGPRKLLCLALASLALLASGCHVVLPETAVQPVLHNPFPQLSRVAVVPFFNQSAEPTVDGRAVALAYFAELQAIPGFEVAPVAAVEAVMRQNNITFDPPEQAPDQARLLARMLGVDAVVVGSITDYDEFYPPRMGLRVDWYAANPGYHPIPAGYGLPWGTPDEEYIPERLVYEAEMELARAQMATQEPLVQYPPQQWEELLPLREPAPLEALPASPAEALPPTPGDELFNDEPADTIQGETTPEPPAGESLPAPPVENPLRGEALGAGANPLRGVAHTAPIDASAASPMIDPAALTPAGWPDARGFTPPGPQPTRPIAAPHYGPVMTHTQIFRGTDPEFTAALASYVDFRDDARFGGWQSYLSRSEDFVRFCCHLHLAEMLTARGGGGETRVVQRWSASR